jgi:hypothetical protein
MRKLASFFVALALVGGAAVASAKTVRYHARHPIPPAMGGGYCYIGLPHVHAYAPAEPRLYRTFDDEYYFVGDPVPYGYDGPHYAYYGPHPVVEVSMGEPVYCYLSGPHYHAYEPVASASFQFRGGAYWYVGTYDPVYYHGRARYRVINDVYQPIVYERPVVDVTVAPPGFHAEVVVGAPPPPRPAFSAGVYVAAPPPPSVHVGVAVGGPPTVVERERVVYGQPPPPRTVIVREERGHVPQGHAYGYWGKREHENDQGENHDHDHGHGHGHGH